MLGHAGFLLTREQRWEIIKKDEKSAELIFSYLNGVDALTDADLDRYDYTLADANGHANLDLNRDLFGYRVADTDTDRDSHTHSYVDRYTDKYCNWNCHAH